MSGENFVSFGEQGAQLTYGSYLQLPKLLDAQRCESAGEKCSIVPSTRASLICSSSSASP